MSTTLYLDPESWDLKVSAARDIALVTDEDYAAAQDAACFIRLFQGELYYDTTQGLPYYDHIFRNAPLSLIKTYINEAALNVPGVFTSQSFIELFTSRVLTGQVQITRRPGGPLSVANF
jgi:hypothetical protein